MNIEVIPALYIVYKRVLFYYYTQRQAKVFSDENTHENSCFLLLKPNVLYHYIKS